MDGLNKEKKRPVNASMSPVTSTTSVISGEVDLEAAENVAGFLTVIGASLTRLPGESSENKDFYSDLLRGLIKVENIARGSVICLFSVIPCIQNTFNGLHGGMVAMIVERVAMACARTVVAEDKELFLAEISLSYLSAATLNEELVVEGSVAKTGRNVTVVTVEIKRKKNTKLMYLSHATFFHGSPIAKL